MKIGDKVIVNTCKGLECFNGKAGTVIGEHISMMQTGFLHGIAKWVVQFDKPVEISDGNRKCCVDSEVFWENELELI